MGRGIVSTETPLPACVRYVERQDALIAAVTRPDADELVGPGAPFLAGHVVPPRNCKIIVLSPDADDAGRAAIEKATPRLQGLGFSVRTLLPPPDMDWCEVLDDFEERRAIVEEPQ
jgi:hypothetical protein